MLGDTIDGARWPNCGEVDIMENIGQEPNKVHGSVHVAGRSGEACISGSVTSNVPFSNEFHVFALDWNQHEISWSVDSLVFKTLCPSDVPEARWLFERPHAFFIILNLAVGGNWPGNPDKSTVFPQV